MAHGPPIDVPLLAATFAFLLICRDAIVRNIASLQLPNIVSALLCAVPLVVFEESINCRAYGCTSVLLPCTTWFLLSELLVLFIILRATDTARVLLPTIICSVVGFFFELFLGAAKGDFQHLAGTKPLVFALVMLWVGFSYTFISFLPIEVLNADRR